MKVGIDIDGVLADFPSAFQKILVEVTGKDLFLPGDAANPPCWNWAQLRGYTDAEVRSAFERIWATDFWRWLQPHRENTYTLAKWYRLHAPHHDVYFVTNRKGVRAKQLTEMWLQNWSIGIENHPTVLLAEDKGGIAAALKLDCYIDDYYGNCVDVVRKSLTRCYLLDRSYNRAGMMPLTVEIDHYTVPAVEENRVKTLEEFLVREGLFG